MDNKTQHGKRAFAVLALLILLVLVAALSGCGGINKPSSKSSHTASTSGPTATVGSVKHSGKAAALKVSLANEKTLKQLDLSVFATLTQGKTVVATQRLSTKPSLFQLYQGDYILSIAFSPCKVKGQAHNCDIFHGGASVGPVKLKGGAPQRVVVTPSCRKVSYGQGFDCAGTKVGR